MIACASVAFPGVSAVQTVNDSKFKDSKLAQRLAEQRQKEKKAEAERLQQQAQNASLAKTAPVVAQPAPRTLPTKRSGASGGAAWQQKSFIPKAATDTSAKNEFKAMMERQKAKCVDPDAVHKTGGSSTAIEPQDNQQTNASSASFGKKEWGSDHKKVSKKVGNSETEALKKENEQLKEKFTKENDKLKAEMEELKESCACPPIHQE